MYENHWQLTTRPFENWADAELYYPSEAHQTAVLKLQYGLENRRAVLVLGGDSGMGKSVVVDRLVEQLPEELGPTARIAFPHLSGNDFLGYVCDRLTGSPGESQEPPRRMLARFEKFLEMNVGSQRHAVIIVDEAHMLSAGDQLETLRLLLNLAKPECTAEASWSLVLVGDATLISAVEQNRPLDERISVKCLLHRFTSDQTAAYLQHRLQVAGRNLDEVFTADAIEAIHMRSGGVPRRINRIADIALMVGFAEELAVISAEQIEGVHQEIVAAAA